MPSGIYKRTQKARAANSKGHTGVPKSPEHIAAIKKGIRNSEAVKAANDAKRGVSRPPETCAKISKTLTGRTLSPEHIAAIKKGQEESDAVKAANEAKKGVPLPPETCTNMSISHTDVPLSPEHSAAIKKGMENSDANKAQIENMRGGLDLVTHHYIYDESDLSKYTVKMTRSDHTKLHHLLKNSVIKFRILMLRK